MPTPTSFTAFFFSQYGYHRDLHSFPTRRSSDLTFTTTATATGTGSITSSGVNDLGGPPSSFTVNMMARSEERRVGKECRCRWWLDDENIKLRRSYGYTGASMPMASGDTELDAIY